MERACKECQNTGWCHAFKKCEIHGETLIAPKEMESMHLPITVAQRIAELAKADGHFVALAKAREIARTTEDMTRDKMLAFVFVDHSEAIFIDGKLFTIKLTFDIPGESGLPQGIEPPYLSPPTETEDRLLGNIRASV